MGRRYLKLLSHFLEELQRCITPRDWLTIVIRIGWAVRAWLPRLREQFITMWLMRLMVKIMEERELPISRSPVRTRTRPPVSTTSCTADTRPIRAAGSPLTRPDSDRE